MTTPAPPILLVTARYLLPASQHQDLLADHGLAIGAGLIIDIAPSAELRRRYPAAAELHTSEGLIMPGLINTHTHAAMACFRGIADDLPLMTWLEQHIFPAERQLSADIVYWSSLLSATEMIRSGTTSFCDMYLFAGEVARAAELSGLRGWIGEVLYDFPSPNYGPLENGFACLHDLLAQYRQHPRIHITVDPHSVYTCSPDLLRRLHDIALHEGAICHVHLSENRAEVETCQQRYGCRPVVHLDRLGLLDQRTLAAHCVQLTGEEIALLARRGVKVSHCLESNMKLASGLAPVVELLAAGVVVSLGTDGSASNNDVDIFSEMNSVAKVHKAWHSDPTVMGAETVLHAATLGGAQALGAAGEIGSLAVGKRADCIVLDLDQPHLTPLYNVPSHLVYAARGADVRHSIIDGRVVMKNRQITTFDEQEARQRVIAFARKISGR